VNDDPLAHAAEILPLYREAHVAYIAFCERGAKVLLAPKSELDFREFELAAARVESAMTQLQVVLRRTWESSQRITQGLAEEAAA
jgi:hypothetical protein